VHAQNSHTLHKSFHDTLYKNDCPYILLEKKIVSVQKERKVVSCDIQNMVIYGSDPKGDKITSINHSLPKGVQGENKN